MSVLEKYKNKLINAFIFCYSRCAGNLKNPKTFDKRRNFERIVIFSTKRLGDFMFTTAAIRAVRLRYPSARIVLVTSRQNAALVTPGENFDRVLPMDNTFGDMRKLIPALRAEKPQLAVTLHSRAPYDVIASVICGCEYLFKDYYRNEPAGLDKWLAGVTRGQKQHIIQRKLDLVSLLGCDPNQTEMFIPGNIPQFEKVSNKKLIGFQMGASKLTHRWPQEHFVKLAQRLINTYPDCLLILIGSPGELEIAQGFMSKMNVEERLNIIDYVGKTTMPELLSIINALDILVTNDTGPLHLAIAAKTKTVSLFVLNPPNENGPYQNLNLHKVIYRPPVEGEVLVDTLKHPMDRIQVEEVFDAVVENVSARSDFTFSCGKHCCRKKKRSVHNRRIRCIAIFELFLYPHAQAENQQMYVRDKGSFFAELAAA